MYFGGIAFLRVELLRGFSSSENPEFGTTLARHLNQSRVSTVLQSNLDQVVYVSMTILILKIEK